MRAEDTPVEFDADAIMRAAEAKAAELGETAFSLGFHDDANIVFFEKFKGNDDYKTAMQSKINAVIHDQSDLRLWSPAKVLGPCGLCYVMCGCFCCDFNMLMGAMMCTKRLHLLGAIPVEMPNGRCGAIGCAAHGGSPENDREIAIAAITAAGYSKSNNNKGWYTRNSMSR